MLFRLLDLISCTSTYSWAVSVAHPVLKKVNHSNLSNRRPIPCHIIASLERVLTNISLHINSVSSFGSLVWENQTHR